MFQAPAIRPHGKFRRRICVPAGFRRGSRWRGVGRGKNIFRNTILFLDIAKFVPYMCFRQRPECARRPIRPRALRSGPCLPVRPKRKPPPVISTEAPLPPSFRPKRSERRNPAGDGCRPNAGAFGVDGAPIRFLHSAPTGGRGSGRNDGKGGSDSGRGLPPGAGAWKYSFPNRFCRTPELRFSSVSAGFGRFEGFQNAKKTLK